MREITADARWRASNSGVRKDAFPSMRAGCAGLPDMGKPLQIAVDGVSDTTEATRAPRTGVNRASGGGDATPNKSWNVS